MRLSVEQVLALAPDAAAAKAGKQHGVAKPWKDLGQSAEALWGQCQGSALYQVKIDLASLTCSCSCPSHKLPCKHSLGLLLLAAGSPTALPEAEPPEWVAAWLAKRAASAVQKVAREDGKKAPVNAVAQAKRADERLAKVRAGVEGLDLWLSDLVRNGLAGLEQQPRAFWEGQAARLVDAQAPGLAGRVRRMAEIAGSGPEWPERLLAEMGRLALLAHAFTRLDTLPAALREEVRQLVGWTLTQEEVATRGEHVADEWLAAGQWVEDEERVRTQRSWLIGARTGRHALVLQFSPKPMVPPFAESILPGTRQHGEVVFWPGAAPLRARFVTREGAPEPMAALPGVATLNAALAAAAHALAEQPWLDRFLFALNGVTLARDARQRWHVRDHLGATLPLAPGDPWRLLAATSGQPADLAAEWDGAALRPLLAGGADGYHPL